MIRITRFKESKAGTFGHLEMEGFSCYTLERNYVGNKPFISSVPLGEYSLTPTTYKSSQSVALCNVQHGIYRHENPLSTRYGILVHAANWVHQLQGCIALGDEMMMMNGKMGISLSVETVSRFMQMHPEQFMLRIGREK